MEDELIYFDSSTTALTPKVLVEKYKTYLDKTPSSYARGTNSKRVTKQIEEIRAQVADFIGARSEEQIVFTAGATYSSNTIAYSYCLHNLKSGDEVVICDADHKSTILPFYNICEILGNFGENIDIKNVEIDVQGDYDEEQLFTLINKNTKILVLTHIHNTYGIEMNIEYIIENIRKINKDVKIVLDATQSVGHINVDVSKLDVDMLYFSGHKMMAMQGVGILYIKDTIEKFRPFIVGGGTDKGIKDNVTSSIDLESGTLNIPAILSLQDAIAYINEIGVTNIENKIGELTRELYEKLRKVKNIEFNKGIDKCACQIGYGILSFKINGITSTEIGEILKDYNIIVRTGSFCTNNKADFIRVSLYHYNTKEEVCRFVEVLKCILGQD